MFLRIRSREGDLYLYSCDLHPRCGAPMLPFHLNFIHKQLCLTCLGARHSTNRTVSRFFSFLNRPTTTTNCSIVVLFALCVYALMMASSSYSLSHFFSLSPSLYSLFYLLEIIGIRETGNRSPPEEEWGVQEKGNKCGDGGVRECVQ